VGRITFRALTADLVERLEVVVRFLAVLELYKRGMVDLDQPRTFGDIEVVWVGRDIEAAGGLDDLSGLDDVGDPGDLGRIDSYDG
jgi:segregation and condensation protein A